MLVDLYFIEEFLSKNTLEYYPSQTELSIPIINRIYQKLILNIEFREINVFEDIIIDGHHRFFASKLANKNIDFIPSNKSSSTQKYDWKNVQFVNVEWGTIEKIEKLNREDAIYNNISVDLITKITK